MNIFIIKHVSSLTIQNENFIVNAVFVPVVCNRFVLKVGDFSFDVTMSVPIFIFLFNR